MSKLSDVVFNEEQSKRIETAIQKAEEGNRGEIAFVVVQSSHDYWWAHWIWSMLGFLVASLVAQVMSLKAPFGAFDFVWLLFIQVVGIAFGSALAFIPPLKRLMIPKKQAYDQVHRNALANFVSMGLTQTELRTGILIFVSRLEHQVQILSDHGIYSKTGDEYWNDQIKTITSGIKSGDSVGGIETAISRMGEKLREVFPAQGENPNEISNKPLQGDQV